MLKVPGLDEHQQAFLAEKQAELKAAQEAEEQQTGSGSPANAALCYKCHTKALVLKDGCMTSSTVATPSAADRHAQVVERYKKDRPQYRSFYCCFYAQSNQAAQ